MHRQHADVHEHGLADDCEGCAEIAESPLGRADTAMVRQFVGLATERPRPIPEGTAQAIAVATVLNTLERAGRLAEVAPDLLERYLRDRWNIRCRIEGPA